jgi:hypothetical protein
VREQDNTPLTRNELNELLREAHEQCEQLIQLLDALADVASASRPGESPESIPLQLLWIIRRGVLAHARNWPQIRKVIAKKSSKIAEKLRRLRGE